MRALKRRIKSIIDGKYSVRRYPSIEKITDLYYRLFVNVNDSIDIIITDRKTVTLMHSGEIGSEVQMKIIPRASNVFILSLEKLGEI